MEILESKIIDCSDRNNSRNLHWNTGDSEEAWNRNKFETKMNPKYQDNPIEYHLNSLGYRCKELDEYEDNNFILVMGCSYTEGVGLHEEDLWWQHMSEKYNLPVMNLAMGGTGIDFQFYNTTLYVKNKLPKPKFVVIQYPGEFRKTFNYPNRLNNLNQNQLLHDKLYNFSETKLQTWVTQNPDVPLDGGEAYDAEWYLNRYIVYPEQANMYNYFYYHSIKNIWNALGIPNAHWAWIDDFIPQDSDFIGVDTEDAMGGNMGWLARDLAHPGPTVQKEAWLQIEKGVEKCLSL